MFSVSTVHCQLHHIKADQSYDTFQKEWKDTPRMRRHLFTAQDICKKVSVAALLEMKSTKISLDDSPFIYLCVFVLKHLSCQLGSTLVFVTLVTVQSDHLPPEKKIELCFAAKQAVSFDSLIQSHTNNFLGHYLSETTLTLSATITPWRRSIIILYYRYHCCSSTCRLLIAQPLPSFNLTNEKKDPSKSDLSLCRAPTSLFTILSDHLLPNIK